MFKEQLQRLSRSAVLATVLSAIAVTLWVGPHIEAQGPTYDLLLRGGRVVDGTGSAWVIADVGIRGDTIAAIGSALPGQATKAIDVTGQVVTPGFIDVHSHAAGGSTEGIVAVPGAENYVRQGVTTAIANPDGGGDVPIAPFLEQVAAARPAINLGSFIGQGSVRRAVVGDNDRKATPDEITRMQDLVKQGMEQGAFGLSTGLFYVPGTYTPTEEVIELAKVAGRYGGIHQSHMREEASRILDSVRETIAIGEHGRLPTQVTHHKIIGASNWGKSVETLKLVDDARARGVDVTIDQYPYTASSTSIQAALIPAWALAGGRDAMIERLLEPSTRQKIRVGTVAMLQNERGGGDPRNVVIAVCEWNPSLAGKSLADIARDRGLEPTVDNAADIALEIAQKGGAGGIFHAISEEDLQRILKHPVTMVASDGGVPIFGKDAPHPRSYGTFARVLGVYVREKNILTLEEAVRKMTALPAERMGLYDRGVLRPGLKADVAVFDAARVKDLATFEKPHQYSVGVSVVVVNGVLVLENGQPTPARPGKILRGRGFGGTASAH